MSIDFGRAMEVYELEVQELLQEIENNLLQLETRGSDPALINAIYRAAHTIKGSSGLVGISHVVSFTHEMESLLDRLRDSELILSDDLLQLLIASRDHIEELVQYTDPSTVPAALQQHSDAIMEQLRNSQSAHYAVVIAEPEIVQKRWHISLRCGTGILRDGMDPLGILDYLASLGELQQVTTLSDSIPPAAEMDPENCYLGFEIDLLTDRSKQEIDEAFEFVRETSQVHIMPPQSSARAWSEVFESLPEKNEKLGELLLRSGVLTRNELAEALGTQARNDIAQPLGEILVRQGSVPRETVDAALDKQARQSRAQEQRFIRVEAGKLDQLITLVGELVISSAVVNIKVEESRNVALREAVENTSRVVEELRDSALGLRMVQIGDTFNRFRRVVRDLSRELGKTVELDITGAETELDKTIVDRIGESILHLVRNAIDHGIEAEAERLTYNKPPQGRVTLNAYHETGTIVLEVRDDGRGLNKQRILEKALARGLVHDPRSLTDSDIYKLIFEPGLSTAESVSNISGRGVGMDAVKQSIEELGGHIEIDSELSQYTVIRLRLPLTLAIIDGFLMGVGKQRFVVPIEMVDECIEMAEIDQRDYVDLRGKVLPYLRLDELFQIREDRGERQSIVVVNYAGKRAGLVVDRLLGDLKTVIKPLGEIFSPLKWISGCTVLGGGEVGLILDVPELISRVEKSEFLKTTKKEPVSGY